MKVVFYTATCFLDISLEVINVLKKVTELHVIIEVTNSSKKQNIISIDSLPEDRPLVPAKELLSVTDYEHLASYFEGAASVNFAVYAKKGLLSSFRTSREIYKLVKKIKPDVFHLEAMLTRSLGLLPAIRSCKKLCISLHDPVPHAGEQDFKQNLTRFIYLNQKRAKTIIFYSEFARSQFHEFYPRRKVNSFVVRMSAFSYFKKLTGKVENKNKYILFFGRLSVYKGVEVLLRAMKKVKVRYPGETLVIAGKSYNGYEPDPLLLDKNDGQTILINRYIPNGELVALIADAKFIVCPYLEATQSGVLMTAFALNKTVIASRTGAFTEYITENENGLLTTPNDSSALAATIEKALEKNLYHSLEMNVAETNKHNNWEQDVPVLLNAYSS